MAPLMHPAFLPLVSALVQVLLLLSAQEAPSGVNVFNLHPPYFNLAEGTKITATATCGEDETGKSVLDLYCKLVGGPVSGDPGHTIQGQYCDICHHGDTDRAHPITNAIDGTERWWQSPPLSRSTKFNQVNVTLELGQLFHVAYILIKFANSPRPDLWVLERSVDFGQTYHPWQYFASSKQDCIEHFGQKTIERIYNDNDIVCTTEYSRIVPLENGEIVVSLVNGRPGAMNFSYSPVLRDFTKATNIRLRFLRTNTLLGHLMGKALRDPTVTRRYYYSIKDITIGGRCVCNGHAEACNAQDLNDPHKLQCECQHNTCGDSCDQCCPGYNQLPWKPATTFNSNECEPCNCHHHSFDCFYDTNVAQRHGSLDIRGQYQGGGVCLNCQHHTTGVNCERCVLAYYRAPGIPLDSPVVCTPCDCESPFLDGTCEDMTGRCFCKENYIGNNCDQCADGFVNFPECYPAFPMYPNNNGEAKPAGEIINCECSAAGTINNSCRPNPQSRTCVCKPGFTGEHCDSCALGYHGLNCQVCQCSGPGCLDGSCDTVMGHGVCRIGFHGYHCDQCAPGYFNYPLCQLCGCSSVGSLADVCDSSGRCLCKVEFQGLRCEHCRSGFHSYPNCQACTCDPRTSFNNSCTASGQCHCRPNYSDTSCDQCASGYYGYPTCTPCQCSAEGSRDNSCDQATGQCLCRHNVHGLRCESCIRNTYGFPDCKVGTCHPAGSVHSVVPPPLGHCECRDSVEGFACDRCKPLYWNLSPNILEGCTKCECSIAGTLSSVAECTQESGQCHCKPNTCNGACATCKDGFYNLKEHSYFGCQSCQCDIGGSEGQTCDKQSGLCRCRPNVHGPKCNLAAVDHYFPDLHHLKFEIEEGTIVDGRPVRFGYDPIKFPGFSWRGYAQMSTIQSKVLLPVWVVSPDLFRMVMRYTNMGGVDVRGRVSVLEDDGKNVCANCSEQSKEIVFSASTAPTFVNIPQNNFVEPFVLNPGNWTVLIEAEGILLDFLVLLPSAYYEAPVLQMHVSEPCMFNSPLDASHNCLQYTYLSLEAFPSLSGNDAGCRHDNQLPHPCPSERLTLHHPDMAVCRGNDINVEMRTNVKTDVYVLVVEYANVEESPQMLAVTFNLPTVQRQQHSVTLIHCTFSFLCRAVAVDEHKRVARFSLPGDTELQLSAENASFFLHKIYLVPHEHFSMEYVEPKVLCISTHGQFSNDGSSCVRSRFQTPSNSLVLKEVQSSSWKGPNMASLAIALPLLIPQRHQSPWAAANQPPQAVENGDYVRLDSQQNAALYSTHVHTLGRYVFILHYHQPLHPAYTIQVDVNGGRIWKGSVNASFCPHTYGCRNVLVSENKIILDLSNHELFLSVQIPVGKTLWLDYVLVVPESSYSYSYLSEEPLDRSYDFINNCGQRSFFIDPSRMSSFCLRAAMSLSAFVNNGSLPCMCHEVGAKSNSCEPFGGQCHCRPNVIGRDCSMCATGYWGFPDCRPCNCGTRLCDTMSGECICPPRTMLPECTQCEPQTFGCHPVFGCELCNCSRPGILVTDVSCDTLSGQCRCKNNVVGRQCDRCASGFYGYPNCQPCDCNEAGTEKEVCNSFTGQCRCKENVQGSRCDQCRIGTFHLDPTNPKGCTTCFCFGATDRCRSSDKRYSEIQNMEGWFLLSADKNKVPVNVYPDQDLLEADLSNIPDVYQELHWYAPKTYLGDKVSSYGGYLRYTLHTQTMRGDVWSLPAEPPKHDIVLKGNQMTVVFLEHEYSSPEEPHLGIVHMVEGSFRHAHTGNSVSREELMMVLVALESLQIRALHSHLAHSVSLRRVILEGAESLPAGRHANNVELCMCPANYLGNSCQKCGPGFYRDTIGLFLGKCVPCNCHGHSDHCLDGLGICMNCEHNTTGNHCEKCQGGFLSNSSLDRTMLSCSSCPCPLAVPSNNFALGCVQKNERMHCMCMPGYAGLQCERCAPGYYGNPMVLGSKCQQCNCHGNTDPNMLFTNCHPVTGECLSCMNNTTGSHCDECAPGYHGDAISAKNCTQCSCSPCGTMSCDPHTGKCRCKPGVSGPQCQRCQDGFFGFESCAGCRPCDCGASAPLVEPCDSQSGQCKCQPGVNGPNCRQCSPGYWNYGAGGCKKCDCKGGPCDPRTGECRCRDGMIGKQCDACSDEYNIPVVHGYNLHCEACESCVIVLLEDLHENDFDLLAVHLLNLNASAMAWMQLGKLNVSMNDIPHANKKYNDSLNGSCHQINILDDEIVNISADMDMLQDKMPTTAHQLHDLANSTSDTHQRAQDLLAFIHVVAMDLYDLLRIANGSLNHTKIDHSIGDQERKTREVEAMLDMLRSRSCVGQKKIANQEKTEAEKVLECVDEVMRRHQEENKNAVESAKEYLSRFHSDMMALQGVLNKAINKTSRATEVNNSNQKTLEDTKSKVDVWTLKRKDVDKQLHIMEDHVAQVNELPSMLHDSKEVYERLAAQLDGAWTPLAKKVEDFSWAHSKISLLEEADHHAKILRTLAMNLSKFVEETKSEVLVDFTKVYTKIISGIKAAEEAAHEADKVTSKALENVGDQNLSHTADSLRNRSLELKKEVEKRLQKLTNELKPHLEEAWKRLNDAKTKQSKVATDLNTVQNNLNSSSSMHDPSQHLDAAQEVLYQANQSASQVNVILNPVREHLVQWQQTYSATNTTTKDVNEALLEAKKTVSMLDDTIPLLLNKLNKLHNHSAQMPNISENINRIRQLIHQARNAASKVNIPVKFSGASGIQVRTPPNLADLASYTSLKFYITLPEAAWSHQQDNSAKQFVFYLGNKDSTKDFLGMALDGRRLRWYFNIGGEMAEVFMSENVQSNGNFNSVVLERILQYGQMSMSSEASEGDHRITKAYVEAGGDQGLLNLLINDTVFYVGGYPTTFKPPPPLALPNFRGCMELDTLNEEVLSLYNFENVFHLNTTQHKPCGRSKPALTQAWVNDAAYFDGTGFAEISFSDESARMQRFEQEVKLISQKGILLLLHNRDGFLCLAVVRGHLKVFFQFGGEMEEFQPKDPTSPLLRVTDARPKVLEIIILRSPPYRVVVRSNRIALFTHLFSENIPAFAHTYFLGGVPEHNMPNRLQLMFPEQGSLKGCFRNIKAQNSHIDLKRMKSSGVSFGCDSDLLVAREAHFSGQSYLDLALTNVPGLRNNFYVSFSFRTKHKDGLMFFHHDKDGIFQVFLYEGHVVVRAGNNQVKTLKTYDDNNSHYVAIYNNFNGLRMYMDDMVEKSKEDVWLNSRGHDFPANMEGHTFLGGMPGESLGNLTGCITNVFIRRATSPQVVVNFLKVRDNINVPLDCPTATRAQQIVAMPLKLTSNPKGKHNKLFGSRSRNTRDSCRGVLMDQEVGAVQFSGSTLSYQRYDSLPALLGSKAHISLDVRIDSSDGLILSMSGHILTLAVSDGHLVLSLGRERKVSLRSRTKMDDKQWHTVFIKRDTDKVSVVVDGIDALSKRISAGYHIRISAPLYVGGVPSQSPMSASPSGFIGCVRDLMLHESPAGTPAYSQGVVPCFQKRLLPGAFFTGKGGHVVLDEFLVLGGDLAIRLEVRLVSNSGLLLHAGTKSSQRLILMLRRGEVVLSLNNGKDDASLSLVPGETLCSGRWHTIAVVKKKNILQLHVDADRERGTGPKHGHSTRTRELVYLGGAPDGDTVSSGLPAFRGCIRHVNINGRLSPFTKVRGSVGTHGCPIV
ncbi:laminin subunit alpha-5 isoform X5 [Syngnathoides biaculeatus]|uniref:laminin subunit alpha-5 isoform X5 n=1 Tax=Syngnathoides biaculeatus TaxID=300417 RepID=UPI002ADD5C42|nr:laminin subunit alpha-5 isoform X5 [Syngnathoides biaculeatus]